MVKGIWALVFRYHYFKVHGLLGMQVTHVRKELEQNQPPESLWLCHWSLFRLWAKYITS